jgi:hypothetical protein
MFEPVIFCPICKCVCADTNAKHRHIEEKHDNVAGQNQELMERTANKELLNE